MEITNKVAVITGAGSGMGAATACYLAQAGAKIVALDVNAEAAKQIAKKTKGLGIACDVTDDESVTSAIENVVVEFSHIHINVNCAGIAPAGRIVGREGPMPLNVFAKAIEVNLIGTFNVMRRIAAQMYQQAPLNEDKERGVIINTASVAAYEGQIGQAAYSASKGGVVAMTLPAAREFGPFGIRVMTIAPGIMDTPMMAGMSESVQQSLAATVTFPQRLGHAEEYAHLVAHIIGNAYLNGEVIRLDGAIRMAKK